VVFTMCLTAHEDEFPKRHGGMGFPKGLVTCIEVRFNLLPFCLNKSMNNNDI